MSSKLPRRKFSKKVILGSMLPFFWREEEHIKTGNSNYIPDFLNSKDEKFWKLIRTQFLIHQKRVYLNNAGLGPSPKVVIDTIHEWMLKQEKLCETYHSEVTAVRKILANFFNADSSEIAITRNTTEGINIVARGLNLSKSDEVLLTTHEHSGNSIPWMALKKDLGIKIKLVELDLSGENNFTLLTENINRKTKVLAIPHIVCTTGMILPIKEIIQFCKRKNIITCIDGAQAAGMINIDLKDLNPDFYVTSGHKWLLGPKGTGLLYINKNIVKQLKPVFTGPHSVTKYDFENLNIEYKTEAVREEYGTRNTPIIMGLGKSINFLKSIGIENIEKRCKRLASYLKLALNKIPEIEILSPNDERFTSAIVTFRIKGKENIKIFSHLINKHQCRVRSIYENNLNAIRVSCGIYNNYEDMDKLISGINDFLKSVKN